MTGTAARPAIGLDIAGDNPVRLWGMTNGERIARLGRAAGLSPGTTSGARIWADSAWAFDPAWFRHVVATPGAILTASGRPVLAHLVDARSVDEALSGGAVIDYDRRPTLYNLQLRKRECPFVEPLTVDTAADIERRSYYGAYKGVTDLLTKYLWPEIALALTRLAARIGMSPNAVSAIGIALCVVATFLFGWGDYWSGFACGFVFMVLDTVDGKLARCTVTSSKWGNVIDHGIDLVHPPFWWVAWGLGTRTTPHPLDGGALTTIIVAILASYVVQRLIEGVFMRRFGMHIHVWRRFDTDFRLVTARRNPNMVILFVSLAAGRPDIGLLVVAWWCVISLVVHAVQLVQALARARRGPLTSWMEQPA